MPTFLNTTFATYFKRIFQVEQASNTGVDSTTRNVQTGDGVNTSIAISDDVLSFQPQNDNTTGTFLVKNQGGSNILVADTSNSKVLVGATQLAANTQYAYFGMGYSGFSSTIANTHYPLIFNGHYISSGSSDVDFGTGTDPDDTFTTANTDTQYAAQIVPMLWRIPDNITIDEVKHFEGADAATGDTTRMHLKSFDITSGSTSCLTNGALVAHSSADVTNDGNEQAYLQGWAIDTADVDAGKVILCFFRSDSINSDFSINVTVKYHVR